jgi:acetyl-CoA carboxylase biotin carboxyl carrier protein
MKPKDFQELLEFIAKSGLAEVSIETDLYKVAVKRDAVASAVSYPSSPALPAILPAAVAAPVVTSQPEVKVAEPAKSVSEDKYLTIKSPMIGTFYRTSSPDTDPFVSIGDAISKGQTVCIIEAMKLFNEIESEISGRIVKILVENATPVEYDQPLFLVDPS